MESGVCVIFIAILYPGVHRDANAQLRDGFTRILAAIHLMSHTQAIEVVPGKTTVARWTALDRRQNAPIHVATHGIGMNANDSSQVRGAQVLHALLSVNATELTVIPRNDLYRLYKDQHSFWSLGSDHLARGIV